MRLAGVFYLALRIDDFFFVRHFGCRGIICKASNWSRRTRILEGSAGCEEGNASLSGVFRFCPAQLLLPFALNFLALCYLLGMSDLPEACLS